MGSLSAHCVGNSSKGVRGWNTWRIVMERCCENFLGKGCCGCTVPGFVLRGVFFRFWANMQVLSYKFVQQSFSPPAYTAPTIHSPCISLNIRAL